MATITRRGDGQWRAEIRKKGFPRQSRTFMYQRDAESWARQIEVELERGLYLPRRDAEKTTFGELADRFTMEFAPHHYRGNGWKHKLARLREYFSDYSLAALDPALVAKYRDQRLAQRDPRYSRNTGLAETVSGATVKTELDLLSKILDVAMKEFSIPLPNGNPVRSIRKPRDAGRRERRLVDDEEDRLFEACAQLGSPWLLPAVKLALATAMRQGELLSMRWDDIKGKKVLLRVTKNGDDRAVPLSSAALEILAALPRSTTGRVFPVKRGTLFKAWERAVKKAGIEDLTFHDLRHESISRFAERGDLSMLELAGISGHKTLAMLKRYTHLHAEDLARKLG